MIFLTAAEELSLAPATCFVVEDASSGVQAAKAGRMAALGVARLDDEALLTEAGADLSGDHARRRHHRRLGRGSPGAAPGEGGDVMAAH
jgi:beta-phosphoglucomutase-like phosphatase (HAD superfamily)